MTKRITIIFLCVFCLFIFAACKQNSEPKCGSILITTEMENSRTIEPTASSITCSTYKLQGEHTSGASFDEETMDSFPYTKTGLLIGTWTLTVNGYNSDGVLIATATEEVLIQKDQTTSAVFNLCYLTGGTGNLSVSFSVSSQNTSVASIFCVLTPVGGGSETNNELTQYSTANNNKVYTLTSSNIATGTYKLTATFKNKNGLALFSYGPEIVRIYKDLTSTNSIYVGEDFMPMVEKPVISPNGGNFTESTEISISCATNGARIYYTLNGDTPTSSSSEYTGTPITITSNVDVVKAIACRPGMASSEVAQTTVPFHISVAAPTISPNGASSTGSQTITIATSTPGASIRYTTNGDNPTSSSGTLYSGQFTITENTSVIKAIAYKDGMTDSSVISSQGFLILVESPTFGLEDSTGGKKRITVSGGTTGATIEYSLDSGATWNTYVIGTTVLEYSTYTEVLFRTSKTGMTSVEETVIVRWDKGNGGISVVNPAHNTVSISTPTGWTGIILEGDEQALVASLQTSTSATYEWYLDGSLIQGKTSSTLTLFSDVEPAIGSHNVSVIVTVGNEMYSDSVMMLIEARPVYNIGDVGPAGGLVFYDCDSDNDSGNTDNLISSECGWRYLELAPSDCTMTVYGYCYVNTLSEGYKCVYIGSGGQYYDGSNANSTFPGIGKGKHNTERILASNVNNMVSGKPQALTVYAAKECDDYEANGYDDWFLPSSGELQAAYQNLNSNENYTLSGSYWSSSESSSHAGGTHAYMVNMINGSLSDSERGSTTLVRAIRAFR